MQMPNGGLPRRGGGVPMLGKRIAMTFRVIAFGDVSPPVYAALGWQEDTPVGLICIGTPFTSPSAALLRHFLTAEGWIERPFDMAETHLHDGMPWVPCPPHAND